MLASQDSESRDMVPMIAKTYIKNTLSEKLNPEQAIAFEATTDYADNPDGEYEGVVITGYAGVGKTFLVKRIIEYIIQTDPKATIAIVAPTNKAVKVLYKTSANNQSGQGGYLFDDVFDSGSRLIYSTVHKLLALKEVVKDNGDVTFEADTYGSVELDKFTHIIIDEGFMIEDLLLNRLMAGAGGKPVIFLGDPAQVPPINQEDSLLTTGKHEYKFIQLQLTTIMRQANGNPIIQASFDLRNNLYAPYPIPIIQTSLDSEGKGIQYIDSVDERMTVRPIIKSYVEQPEYLENPDLFKVLAWKRDTVAYVNSVVRETLYGMNPPRFVLGEKLLTNKPVFEQREYRGKRGAQKKFWSVKVANSEELTLLSITDIEVTIPGFNGYQETFKGHKLSVSYHDYVEDNVVVTDIDVVADVDFQRYARFIKELHDIAIRSGNRSMFVQKYNALKYFADIAYNYALTVHKSQGSTYETVLVMEEDIDKNPRVRERNRIKYTAFTRASKKLYVLRKNKSVVQDHVS